MDPEWVAILLRVMNRPDSTPADWLAAIEERFGTPPAAVYQASLAEAQRQLAAYRAFQTSPGYTPLSAVTGCGAGQGVLTVTYVAT
jgi:hypothetical protein